jgi:sirohydrochlorin ferrochelatase
MKAILLIAHGSPRPEANEDVVRVAELVRARVPLVVVGYLDCNQPDIPTALDACVAAGASAIAAVPYFLHSGRHFLLDLPALLDEGAQRHPGVTITMGDYIGHLPELAGVLRDRVAL